MSFQTCKMEHKLRCFWFNPRAFWLCIDNNANDTFKVQMCCGTLDNGGRWLLGGEEFLNKVCMFFAHKKYSCSFVKLCLNHWYHMDCFTDVLTTFLCLGTFQYPYSLWRVRKLIFHQKYLVLFQRWKMVLLVWNNMKVSNVWPFKSIFVVWSWGQKHAHLLNHLSLVFNAEQGLKPQKVWTRKGASSLGWLDRLTSSVSPCR